MIVKMGLRDVGSFSARAAGYEIFPNRNGRIAACQPYKFPTNDSTLSIGEQGFDVRNQQEFLSIRLTMPQIFSAMGTDSRDRAVENKAVVVSPGLVPAEVEQSFSLAGPEFAADFAKLSNIIFCPLVLQVTDRGINWSPGFELGMIGLEPAVQKAFLGQAAPYLGNPAKIVFVSSFSSEKLPIPGEELHWNLSFLVGRVKVNALAIAQGLTVHDFGERARDCFAQLYQVRFTQNLLEESKKANPDLPPEKQDFFLKYLIGFDQMADRAANLMTPAEKQILNRMFGGESLTDIHRYNRAFVEAMLGQIIGQ